MIFLVETRRRGRTSLSSRRADWGKESTLPNRRRSNSPSAIYSSVEKNPAHLQNLLGRQRMRALLRKLLSRTPPKRRKERRETTREKKKWTHPQCGVAGRDRGRQYLVGAAPSGLFLNDLHASRSSCTESTQREREKGHRAAR